MIYVSSACVKATKIKDAVEILQKEGFSNIELSGGTQPYEQMLDDLLELKDKYQLNYLCHNYFPPPQEAFVLNLASLDEEIAEKSLVHCFNAIDLSKKLGAKKFAVHAGFLINIPVNQIGKKIDQLPFFDERKGYLQFEKNLAELIAYAGEDVKIYIENNVISSDNFKRFKQKDPFFYTSAENLGKIDNKLNFEILLDVAHLKVSCHSLNLDFKAHLKQLFDKTDYIHISDNDGLSDLNLGLERDGDLHEALKQIWKKNKTVTLETYDGMERLKETYKLIEELNE